MPTFVTPTVPGRVVRSGVQWQFQIQCPYCGKTHYHAAGIDPNHPDYGHRHAHCIGYVEKDNSAGYVIVPERK